MAYAINGVEITDIIHLKEAMDYLNKDYNDGKAHIPPGEKVLCITFKSDYIPTGKWGIIRDNPDVKVTFVGVSEGKAYIEVRNA